MLKLERRFDDDSTVTISTRIIRKARQEGRSNAYFKLRGRV